MQQWKVLALGSDWYLHCAVAAEIGEQLRGRLAEYHRQSPESPGMTWEQLAEAVPRPRPVLEAVVRLLMKEGRVVEQSQRLGTGRASTDLSGPRRRPSGGDRGLFPAAGFCPAQRGGVGRKTCLAPAAVEKLLGILQEHRRLVAVGDGLLFHCEAVERARRPLVEHIEKEGRLESVQFKYLVNTTRKFALPLLDYFDRTGLLRRVGNTRDPKGRP